MNPTNRLTRPLAGLVVALLLVPLAACGSDSDSGSASGGSGSSSKEEKGDLTVLAAASLTETFTTLAEDFEKDHPGVDVKLSFDSSATLAEQVTQGAPADVLATADEATMQTVVDADGTEGDPQVFATNHLVLAVPKGNPAGITSLEDLAKPGVKFVVCVDTAPCGKLAVKVLDASGSTAKPASEEVDVKAVLSKVEMDEADAGLVYASDVATAEGKVEQVDLPTDNENLNTYPIAALSEAKKPTLAKDWVTLVTGSEGQAALAKAGFGKP